MISRWRSTSASRTAGSALTFDAISVTSGVRISSVTSSPSSSTRSPSVDPDAGGVVAAQRGERRSAVHGAGVQELEAERAGDRARDGGLARACGAVDRDEHGRRQLRGATRSSAEPGGRTAAEAGPPTSQGRRASSPASGSRASDQLRGRPIADRVAQRGVGERARRDADRGAQREVPGLHADRPGDVVQRRVRDARQQPLDDDRPQPASLEERSVRPLDRARPAADLPPDERREHRRGRA